MGLTQDGASDHRPRPITIMLWAIRAWLAFLVGYSFAVQPVFTSKFLLASSALLGLGVSAGFALIPTRRPSALQKAEAIVLASFILHVMGHAFGLYARFTYYDKLLHFVVPAGVVYALFALSQATRWIWSWSKVRPIEVAVYLCSIMVTITVAWEIFEFTTDTFFGTSEQGGQFGANFDTMTDLIVGLAGAVVGSSIAAGITAYGHHHGLGTITEAHEHLMRRWGRRAFARRLEARRWLPRRPP
ncbi:MAG: hypothetical protein WDA16_12510 [Candidatus Thermoplasmatota archaeon]